jgi:tetratricopeptide (TPR) repeat protein
METMVYKNKNGAAEVTRKLGEGKKHLQDGNLFSSIVALREVLDAFINLRKVPQNEKNKLAGTINDFQRTLASSQEFNDLYGKVYFRENDFSTSYDFLCQLIKIKEEEITDVLVNENVGQMLNLNYLSREDQKTTKLMVSLVERGEMSALRELVDANDNLGSLVLAFYNETGINHRLSGNMDRAIIEYKKALSVSPSDENLYYNMARAYIEIGQKQNAEASITQALQINPQFSEGLKLANYIKNWPP